MHSSTSLQIGATRRGASANRSVAPATEACDRREKVVEPSRYMIRQALSAEDGLTSDGSQDHGFQRDSARKLDAECITDFGGRERLERAVGGDLRFGHTVSPVRLWC